jgi:hypothetical protein
MKPAPHHLAEFWANAETHQRIFKTKLCMTESPADACDSRIVQAHTVPRSQLRQIAVDGHVYSMAASPADLFQNDGLITAKEIGINKFSVLNCFCAKHDNDLFSPIEDEPLVFNPRQLALLQYRTVASEVYRKVMGHRTTLNHLGEQEKKKPHTAEIRARMTLLRSYAYGEELALRDSGVAFALCEEELFSETHDGVSALIVHFKKMPSAMTVGGFLPECDYYGNPLQALGNSKAIYQAVSFNILAAKGHATLALLWIKGQNVVKSFADSFVDQKPERYTTLAIQTAFEHLENTCMAPHWWENLPKAKQDLLLRRMQIGGSPFEERKPSCLTYCGVTFDDWKYDHHEFINT